MTEITIHLPIVLQEACKLSREDRFTREDLVQEGLIAAFSAAASYDPERGLFEAYIRTCARNRMISYLRRNKHESPMEDEALAAKAQEAVDFASATPPEEQQERIEIRESLAQLMRSLSAFEQKVLFAYLREGSVQHAADALGCKRKSVDNALQRIRNKARRNEETSKQSEDHDDEERKRKI